MKQLRLFLLLLLLTIPVPRGIAQTSISRTGSADHPVLSFGFGPAGSTISRKPNAPFSAVAVEGFEQTLNDGTTISRENHEIVMRDSAGRIYRGRELKSHSTDREPLIFFTVTDPVKHIQFRCLAVGKRCSIMQYRQPPHNDRFPSPRHIKDVTIEDLGDSSIRGVQVMGRRFTRVIPEGSAGNDRPFDTGLEIWYSKELDVDVEVKRTDPRFGVRTTTLTQLDPSEPDPTFFQIPEGYTVGQLHQSVGAMAPLPQSGLPALPSIAPGIP
jgi:hypothetical protein